MDKIIADLNMLKAIFIIQMIIGGVVFITVITSILSLKLRERKIKRKEEIAIRLRRGQMSADIQCPYCGVDQKINPVDGMGYAEDEIHQQECGDCGKMFVFTTSISYYYDADKADCLNEGGKHTFNANCKYPNVYFDKMDIVCSQCGKRERIDYKEAYLHGYDQKEVNWLAERDKKMREEGTK